ncbi:MAG: endonuclease/exonuclease/phosphatase family protein [Bacteroidota bacterium]
MKIFKKALKIFFIVTGSLLVLFAAFLIYSTCSMYKPAAVEKAELINNSISSRIAINEFSFITWNIGYCGLGKEMDFFYDGGKSVRPDATGFQKYLNGVFSFISNNDSVDFLLLQEVDRNSRRSYYQDEASLFSQALSGHAAAFSKNYDVGFVPVPLFKPMGQVNGGIMTLSRWQPTEATRYDYPLKYSWPTRLFMLERCFMLERYNLLDGKELVIINLHNSAFADADLMRQYELWMVRGFAMEEFGKGNYVVMGGDWNQSPPGFGKLNYYSSFNKKQGATEIPPDFIPPGWNWGVDKKNPTNREVYEAYRPGLTPVTTLDFFITSPNIKIQDAHVVPQAFGSSDHEPVYMRVRLLSNPLDYSPAEVKDYVKILQDSLAGIQTKNVKKPVKKKK